MVAYSPIGNFCFSNNLKILPEDSPWEGVLLETLLKVYSIQEIIILATMDCDFPLEKSEISPLHYEARIVQMISGPVHDLLFLLFNFQQEPDKNALAYKRDRKDQLVPFAEWLLFLSTSKTKICELQCEAFLNAFGLIDVVDCFLKLNSTSYLKLLWLTKGLNTSRLPESLESGSQIPDSKFLTLRHFSIYWILFIEESRRVSLTTRTINGTINRATTRALESSMLFAKLFVVHCHYVSVSVSRAS